MQFKFYIICIFLLTSTIVMQSNATSNNTALGSLYSNNWAGYVLTPYTYSINNEVLAINGTFTVPLVTHSQIAPLEQTATWIGIGGYHNDSTLIQTGVWGINNNGTASYYAWYELLPAPPTTINMIVRPNDTIYAQIGLVNSTLSLWNISLTDLSTGKTFSKTINYNSSFRSAEWVVEAPAVLKNSTVLTIAPFSTVQFNNAYYSVCGATKCSINSLGQKYKPKILFINQSNGRAATPSAIFPDNLSFSVTYTGVPATTQPNLNVSCQTTPANPICLYGVACNPHWSPTNQSGNPCPTGGAPTSSITQSTTVLQSTTIVQGSLQSKSNTYLYLGVILVILIVGAASYYVWKKPKK